MLQPSTIQLLRFHFSFFLLPVYLFALSQVQQVKGQHAVIIFFILHLLVYPSSNGYNSYMDRDSTPIGGLKNPMQPTRQLFYVTITMDVMAVTLSVIVSTYFAYGVLLYILASRAYSYRGIRLKKYPVTGYLVVVICQGLLVFFLTWHGSSLEKNIDIPLYPMLAAGCLIGGYYPLTQIYQHDDDLQEGVRTISYILGKRGTFIFSGLMFGAATILVFFTFEKERILFLLFLFCMVPVLVYFVTWMLQVWKDGQQASFRHSLKMNILASACTTVCFGTYLLIKIF